MPSRYGLHMTAVDPMRPDGQKTERIQLLITPRHREMLVALAHWQRRSMNSVLRLAIERIYEVELLAAQKREITGVSRGTSHVSGKTT